MRCFAKAFVKKLMKPPPTTGAECTERCPDYTSIDAWAAHPGKDSPAELVPPGETAIPVGDRATDVFYVHPTSYFGDHCRWNQNVMDAGDERSRAANEKTVQLYLATQASVFNREARIWAPFYRQAHIASFFSGVRGRQPLDTAYGDILKAFEMFLSEIGDRPFILASHSQGTVR